MIEPKAKAVFSVSPDEGAPRKDYTIDRHGIKTVKKTVVAFNGKCVVVAERDEFAGGEQSKAYRSPVLENPTWGRLLRVATAAINRTRDHHHIYLEGYSAVSMDGDVAVIRLFMGS